MASIPHQRILRDSRSKAERWRDFTLEFPGPFLLQRFDTTEDYFEELIDEDLRCEYLNEVLIVHSPASPRHEELIMFIGTLINNFVAARKLGRVYASNLLMQNKPRRTCADVSFVRRENRKRVKKDRVIGAIDLAVEVLSPSTRRFDLGEKRDAYRAVGVPEIWFIDADERGFIADVRIGRRYETRQMLRGRFESRVLTGLSVDVSWFWRDPLPSPLDCVSITQR